MGACAGLLVHVPVVVNCKGCIHLQGFYEDHGVQAHDGLQGTSMPKLSAALLHQKWCTPVTATRGQQRTVLETPRDAFADTRGRQSHSSEMSEDLLSFQMDSQSSSPGGDCASLDGRSPGRTTHNTRDTAFVPSRDAGAHLSAFLPSRGHVHPHLSRYRTPNSTPGKSPSFMEALASSLEGDDTPSGYCLGKQHAWHPLMSTRSRATFSDLSSPLHLDMSSKSPGLEDWLL